MITEADLVYGSVSRRIGHYRETTEQWKTDYEEAALLHKLENWIAGFLELHSLVVDLDSSWQSAVFRGKVKYDSSSHDRIKGLYRKWLDVSKLADPLIEDFERRNFDGGVANIKEYRSACRSASDALDSHEKPTPSLAVGLREMKLDKTASDELKAMFDRAASQPAKPVEPMPVKDASFLRQRSH